jgi:hypothetical protein
MKRTLVARSALVVLSASLVLWESEGAWAQQPPSAEPAEAAPAEPQTVPAASTPEPDTARFQGSYTYVGGSKERTDLNDAVDRVVAGFFPIKRIIMGRRLRERNPVFSMLSISFPNEMIEVKSEENQLKSPLNGEAAPGRTPAGDDAKVSQRFEDGRLIQVIEIENATRQNELSLSADGGTLIMNVKVTSPEFAKALHYRLTYRRAGGK